MIEEAAGTRMYENKKAGALRTLEKKQNKVDEINRLLSEEITPTLEKLQRERANYMLWMSNNNEIERLQRFCTAYEYVQVKHRLENKNQQLEEMESSLRQLVDGIQTLKAREKQVQVEIKERAASRDVQRSKELKRLEEEQSKLTKEVAATESKLKNRESDLEAQLQSKKQGETTLAELYRQAEEKEKVSKKEQEKFDALSAQEGAVRKEIEKAQWSMQALTAGMSAQSAPEAEGQGDGKSLREELLAAQTRLSEMEAEQQTKAMSIRSFQERLAATEHAMTKSTQDGQRLAKEKFTIEGIIGQKRAEIASLAFNVEHYGRLLAAARQAEANLHSMQEKLDHVRAQIGGIDFNYADPYKNFDRSKVKGVVAKLFHIKPEFACYHRALEVCAGGRLFFVVVDNEDTGKALLERGQLRRRVTIIPLNKIVDPTIPAHVVRQARNIMPAGGDLHLAMEIVGFQWEVESAMKYVFGGFIVCDTPETAKQVTFHPNVRVRSVTKDGDLYDPAGTITGGSAPKGGNLLARLQELSELEWRVQQQHGEYRQEAEKLQHMQAAYSRYSSLDRELKCKEHELTLIDDRINRSEYHTSEQTVHDLRTQLTQFESDLHALPEEKKRLEKAAKQLEKDIKNLDSGREERIQYFEQQVEKLKAVAKQHADKLDKQREKTEQANVELEVLRNEIAAQEGKEQATEHSHGGLAGDVQKLRDLLDQRHAAHAAATAQLEALRLELQQLDQVLADFAAELTSNRQQQEEKELEHKRVTHKVQQLQKDDKEAHVVVAKMEKQHMWIEKEKSFFGKRGTDFDFEANSYQENKTRHDELGLQQKTLSKNINKKAMVMFEKAEQEYKDLLQKRDIILNDKCKIEHVIRDLDEKKTDTLRRTWVKVNKDFGSIFSTLLPNTNAKLEPPAGMDPSEGLEIKVAFNGNWKQSLSELSGGQRSLLALSLVLALLLFKPAPMYILDEIDSALDLSHTQNIGHMIRTHFPHSQFIVVSLKEGMFNHANVLFRTRFMDGTSGVTRYAIRDIGDRVEIPGEEGKENEGQKASRKRKAPT